MVVERPALIVADFYRVALCPVDNSVPCPRAYNRRFPRSKHTRTYSHLITVFLDAKFRTYFISRVEPLFFQNFYDPIKTRLVLNEPLQNRYQNSLNFVHNLRLP